MGEDGGRPDGIERSFLVRKRGPLRIYEHMQGRDQVCVQPLDAGSVYVASPELGPLSFGEELSEHATGPTPEIEHALPVEAPIIGQGCEELIARKASPVIE